MATNAASLPRLVTLVKEAQNAGKTEEELQARLAYATLRLAIAMERSNAYR